MSSRGTAVLAGAVLVAGCVFAMPGAASASGLAKVSQGSAFGVQAGPEVGTALVATAVDPAAADRIFVRWLAGSDPRSAVRTSAWTALISSRGDAAVADFLATGFASAKKRAAATKARNADFAQRVLATHTAEYSPEVHAAALQAVDGSDADRERFAKTEYAAAKERDRLARESEGRQVAAIIQADRDFVAGLRTSDPGEQVRAAAGYALRAGADDDDVVEFFAYDWSSAAALDLETYRTRRADEDTVWRVTIRRLLIDAQAAQAAAAQAAPEGAAAARAAAASAWRAVANQTTPARSAWAQAEQLAVLQAENWQRVVDAALAANSPNWTPIGESAQTNGEQWSAEQGAAAQQSAYWTGLLEQALAGELAMQQPG